MKTPKETFAMKTNFSGLIQLLAKNLYSEVYVFMRELLQNGGDSITLRREIEPDHEGRIEIFTHPGVIIIRDNGKGMDDDDIREFLSVIGSTGTGSARKRLEEADHANARQLVGQFGIGMLSAFVVAKKVIVRTRKLDSDKAWAWHNDGSTECQLFEDDKADVGTEVILILEEKHESLLESKSLHRAIRKYCDFLRYPIFLNDEGPVNVMNAPWHEQYYSTAVEKNSAYANFLNSRFPDYALKVIPVDLNGPIRVQGALYITEGKIPDLNSNGRVDLYVRRFLISEGDSEILPQWAPFVGGIINCPDLKPTAARDNVQRNDPNLLLLRKELAKLIVEYLARIAHDEPSEFAKINEAHNYHLKGMALFYDEFFNLFGDQLLFDTNQGKMSLNTYLNANQTRCETGEVPLYHFSQRQGRGFFYEMADKTGLVIIDAKRSFEKELLAKFVQANEGRVLLAPVDVGISGALFRTPEQADTGLVDRIELELMQVLSRSGFANVDVQVRCFLPASVPSVALATQQTIAHKNLKAMVSQNWAMPALGALSEEIQKAMADAPPVRIVVNLENALVREIAEPKYRGCEMGDILSALVFDNPAGGLEIVSEKLRRHAADCKHRILREALKVSVGNSTTGKKTSEAEGS